VHSIKNKARVEANILGRVADKEVCGLMMKPEAEEEAIWGVHDMLRSELIDVADAEGDLNYAARFFTFNINEQAGLHKMYIFADECFSKLWEHFVTLEAERIVQSHAWGEGDASRTEHIMQNGQPGWEFSPNALYTMHRAFYEWGRGQRLSAHEALVTEPIPRNGASLKQIRLGSGNQAVTIKVNDWVLARPNDEDLSPIADANESLPQFGVPKRMWFGQVKQLFQHKRQGLESIDVVKAEWHASVESGPYDTNFMAPIVRRGVAYADDPFIPARSLLPMAMIALRHPQNRNLLVMVCKSWLPLAAANMPVPFPPLEFYPNVDDAPAG